MNLFVLHNISFWIVLKLQIKKAFFVMKAFIVAIASFVALLAVVSAEASKDTRIRCIPHQLYTMDCNLCICSSMGFHLFCTKKSCPYHKTCIHGKMKETGNCEICICNGGSWYCYASELKGKKITENNNDRITEFSHV